jgi:hypothetical protein
LNENAVLDDRPRARQQKPSLIDAQRQSTSKKLLAFNNQCDDHQHAATPPRHPDCREALIQIVALHDKADDDEITELPFQFGHPVSVTPMHFFGLR